MPKLKLCWVARAAFSLTESSLQGTNPVSLNGVTDRLRDVGLELLFVLPWVAYGRALRNGRIEVAEVRRETGRNPANDFVGFIVGKLEPLLGGPYEALCCATDSRIVVDLLKSGRCGRMRLAMASCGDLHMQLHFY
jgi:hypothetical protein